MKINKINIKEINGLNIIFSLNEDITLLRIEKKDIEDMIEGEELLECENIFEKKDIELLENLIKWIIAKKVNIRYSFDIDLYQYDISNYYNEIKLWK